MTVKELRDLLNEMIDCGQGGQSVMVSGDSEFGSLYHVEKGLSSGFVQSEGNCWGLLDDDEVAEGYYEAQDFSWAVILVPDTTN